MLETSFSTTGVEKKVQGRQSKASRALSSTSTTPSRVHETNKRTLHTSASRSSSVVSSAAAAPTMIAAPAAVRVTLSCCLASLARSLAIELEQEKEGKACDYSPPPVPTSSESSLQAYQKPRTALFSRRGG